MREELKLVIVPYLRELGFKGKLPSFRRIKDGSCQTLNFQFNKYGKKFAVNLSIVNPSEDFLSASYDSLIPLRSQRLGTRQKRISRQSNMDHWFKFLKGFIFYRQAYQQVANDVISLLESESEAIYQDLIKAVEKNVFCVHLDSNPKKLL